MKKHTPEELLKRLSAPLPEEALRKGTFTDGRPNIDIIFAYQLRRMNDVFTLTGWSRQPKILSVEKCGDGWEATATVTVSVPILKRKIKHYGGCVNTSRGDALKGAVTNATGKCFQELGIAEDVYMGKHNPQTQLSANGNKSMYLSAVESGWLLADRGETLERALEIAREEWEKKS